MFESLRGREAEYHEAFARPAVERYRCMSAHGEEGLPRCEECALFFQAAPCFPPYFRGTLLEVRGRWILVEFEPPGFRGHFMHPAFFVGGENGMDIHARGVAHSGTRWIALTATESTESLSAGLEVTSFGEAPIDATYWVDPNERIR